MALRHWDGFTGYSVVGDLSANGLYTVADTTGNLSIVANGGSAGQGALRFGAASNSPASIYKTITSSSHAMVGFWIDYTDFSQYSDGYDAILKLSNGAYTEIAELILYNTGELAIRTGGYTLEFRSSLSADSPNGAEVNYLSLGSHRVELSVKISTTVGELLLVVDGKIWCQKTLLNTGSSNCDRVYFQTADYGSGAKFDIDTVYVFDGTGTYNNTLLNDWKCEILRPDADDGTPGFTKLSGAANYEMVDDVTHDADATHNYSTGNAQVDLFTTSDTLSGLICRVAAVNVCCVARRDDTAQNFRTKIVSGASTSDGANVALVNPDWVPVIQTFASNPATAAQWVQSEVEAAKFGYESRA